MTLLPGTLATYRSARRDRFTIRAAVRMAVADHLRGLRAKYLRIP